MKRLLSLALATVLATAACGGAPGEPDAPGPSTLALPAEAASIIGDVTQVERSGGAVRILVEQVPTRSAGYPIAWVYLGPDTRILARTAGGPPTRADAALLATGTRVQAWFTGLVRESYPVQADAATLLVER